MTYGIDIATYQETLDVSDAVAAGTQFAGAKAVASYLPHLTVAEAYHSNIDDIIEAGLDHAKFHYAVPNSQNTPKVTAQFLWGIRYRAKPTDAYMLDNEPLDGYAVYWRDDDAAEFFEELHSLGARYDQMWFYCPAFLTRSSGPWPKMLALREKGVKIVWVSYGDLDAILEPGEEPFVGDTGFTDPELHQFTSTWTVPGWTGKIDRIFSRLTVGELFRGGIVSLESKARAFAARYPTSASHPYGGDNDWDQDCGRVMNRFAEELGWVTHPRQDVIYSAYSVAMNSGWLNPNAQEAPVGAWHFWDIGGPANGHVAQEMDGNKLIFMGSWKVWEDLGRGIGFSSVSEYGRLTPDARYMGWATNYAGGTISTAGTAGGDYIPIEEEDIMATIDEVRTVVREVVREELSIVQDRLRRESRLRLYRNVETGQMIAVDPETGAKGVVIGPWDAIADPGKAVSLRVNYALTADTPEQAQQLDNRQWGNLLRDLGITVD